MFCHSKLNKRLRYRQKIIDDLRARFRVEYLGQLLLKEGMKESRKVKVGDVVLVGDDIHKRIDWPLARVIEEISGRDGKTRVFINKKWRYEKAVAANLPTRHKCFGTNCKRL